MSAGGYVVRGTHRRGWPVFAYDHDGAFGGPSETDIPLHVFPSLDTAAGGRAHMVRCGCTEVAIFRVHDDGREERLPSYEEALEIIRATIAETCAPMGHADLPGFMQRLLAEGREDPDLEPDPLAALEAAERRLLEAGGWVRIHGDPNRWSHPDGGNCSQADAVYSERLDLATRLAAKGGA